ncbi:hypothetical protein, partial [Paracoccus sp. C2R09]|uniref:hypothetical protein n=1 Tax=Paracoccus sp. C2R09 TaxID=2839896 RepID=UPI0035300CBB|nr:hypothetical protein [Paracoccus sp. C2R09]
QLSEFRSGAMGDESKVTSGVRLDGSLVLDLVDWAGSTAMGETVLIDVDELIGSFRSVRVEGLGINQDALIRIDYAQDEVTLVLGEDGSGSGMVKMATSGVEAFVDYSDDAALAQLWDALAAPGVLVMDDPLI